MEFCWCFSFVNKYTKIFIKQKSILEEKLWLSQIMENFVLWMLMIWCVKQIRMMNGQFYFWSSCYDMAKMIDKKAWAPLQNSPGHIFTFLDNKLCTLMFILWVGYKFYVINISTFYIKIKIVISCKMYKTIKVLMVFFL